jgi:hypothetical protein
VYEECQNQWGGVGGGGGGVGVGGGDIWHNAYVDIRHRYPLRLMERFQGMHVHLMSGVLPLDFTRDAIPVMSMANYTCEGMTTDLNGCNVSVNGCNISGGGYEALWQPVRGQRGG